MRASSVLRTLLALHRTRVVAHEFTDEALIADVVPNWQLPRCSGCGKKRRSVYDSRVRVWRHLDFGGIKTLLRYRTRRVSCKKCGVVVETVPWAEAGSRFTLPMEGHVTPPDGKPEVDVIPLVGGDDIPLDSATDIAVSPPTNYITSGARTIVVDAELQHPGEEHTAIATGTIYDKGHWKPSGSAGTLD